MKRSLRPGSIPNLGKCPNQAMWADFLSIGHLDGDWENEWVILTGSRWNKTGDAKKKRKDKSRKDKWWWRKQESNNRTVWMSGVAAGVSHMAFLLLCHVAQRDINRGFWCYSSWETNRGESVTKPDKKVTPIASPLYKAEKKRLFKKWQIEEEDWIKEVTGKISACQKTILEIYEKGTMLTCY